MEPPLPHFPQMASSSNHVTAWENVAFRYVSDMNRKPLFWAPFSGIYYFAFSEPGLR
jgi:hypothetical protein